MGNLAAVILAGGGSTRLGTAKQLLEWGRVPLLEHVLNKVERWPVDSTIVVLGAQAEAVLDAVDFGGAAVVINPDWEEGIASSLRVGLDAVSRDAKADAVLVVLGDQPDVADEVVKQLVDAYRSGHRHAYVPKYRYTRSTPVILGRAIWSRVMSLEGDAGAQRLLKAHPEWVEEVWFDRLPPRDVDTAADAAELRPRS